MRLLRHPGEVLPSQQRRLLERRVRQLGPPQDGYEFILWSPATISLRWIGNSVAGFCPSRVFWALNFAGCWLRRILDL